MNYTLSAKKARAVLVIVPTKVKRKLADLWGTSMVLGEDVKLPAKYYNDLLLVVTPSVQNTIKRLFEDKNAFVSVSEEWFKEEKKLLARFCGYAFSDVHAIQIPEDSVDDRLIRGSLLVREKYKVVTHEREGGGTIIEFSKKQI